MSADYGEMMAAAAGDGFDSPEAASAARYYARLERDDERYDYPPDDQPNAPAAPASLHQVALPR